MHIPSLPLILLAITLTPKTARTDQPAPAHHSLKLGVGVSYGLVHLNHTEAGATDFAASAGWDFLLGDRFTLTPYALGGVSLVTPSAHSSHGPKVLGLLALGLRGGINLAPISPYLLAEGYLAPGLGLSLGAGTLYHLTDSLSLDLALHWIRIPNALAPFGTPSSGNPVADLNEFGLFAGIEVGL